MKHFFKASVLFVCTLLYFRTASQAQDKPSSSRSSAIRLSLGVDGSLPVGTFSDNYNWSLGGSFQADFPIIPESLYITANAGFHNFFYDDDKTGRDLRFLPVKAGLKYFVFKPFYVQADAGASFITNKTQLKADKTATFTYSGQVGTLLPIGGPSGIDIGFRYERNSNLFAGQKSPGFFALRVAYSLGL